MNNETSIPSNLSENSESLCEMCFKKLSEKRTINISCHIVHWTCLLKMCETYTREDRKFPCPICEQAFKFEDLCNENGKKLPDEVIGFGPIGQPNEMMLLEALKSNAGTHTMDRCLGVTSNWLVHVCQQLEEARNSDKPVEYVRDIADERVKLLNRCRLIINLLEIYDSTKANIAAGYKMHEKSKKNESIVVNIEEILPCTTCVGLTFAVNGKEKTVKSMANFNYSEHASHIDNFNSIQEIRMIDESNIDAKDMLEDVKEHLYPAHLLAVKTNIEEGGAPLPFKEMIQSNDNSNKENEEDCSICIERLNLKRSIKSWPCNHRFHRTCALLWFETQTLSFDISCPLCRTVVSQVTDKHGQTSLQSYPFEKDKRRLLRKKIYLADEILAINRRTITLVTRELQHQRSLALKHGKSAEWIADIDEELEKNRERCIQLGNYELHLYEQQEIDKAADVYDAPSPEVGMPVTDEDY